MAIMAVIMGIGLLFYILWGVQVGLMKGLTLGCSKNPKKGPLAIHVLKSGSYPNREPALWPLWPLGFRV